MDSIGGFPSSAKDSGFAALAGERDLAPHQIRDVDEHGFVLLPGLVPAEQAERLARAYDAAVAAACADDVRVGSTTTRVTDFVNRGPEFDAIYVTPSLLAVCWRIIGRPFKLSSLHGRTLRPDSPAQPLHVDVRRGSLDCPLVGFILMIDEFRSENGATRFVPGTHRRSNFPEDVMSDSRPEHKHHVLATGPAGSMVVFHGSIWHGHSANESGGPRRSLQGAFVPREGRAATDFGPRMRPDTRARLGPIARCVLEL